MSKVKIQELDVQQIIKSLFEHLNPREREILTRRYGLGGKDTETLEKIGKSHQITRERVRQIEANSIRKLNKIDAVQKSKTGIDTLGDVVYGILSQSAGVIEEDQLVETVLSVHKKINDIILKQSLYFLLTYILQHQVDRVEKHSLLSKSWKLKAIELFFIEEIINALVDLITSHEEPMTAEELIKAFEKTDFYKANSKKVMELCDLNHDEKLTLDEIIISYLSSSQVIKLNLFNQWGLSNWKIVSPKTINDKIYLVLKKEEKPLHYKEIALLINAAGFDKKTACAATVHNELIIDKKYVLVGRGYYALREWGYEDGTVEDVIEKVLKKAAKPLEKEDIMDQVLEKKIVKRSTIYLALLNKEKFKKVEGSKYTLK
jgi:sigma-70-like protein